ncbi:MAG: hypothetical protein K0Q74_94 [Gammaproteobacteria bacterium]|jgi:hypothetical protein|nr:hypothetical protein [Gammaproteobacteria bacterium]
MPYNFTFFVPAIAGAAISWRRSATAPVEMNPVEQQTPLIFAGLIFYFAGVAMESDPMRGASLGMACTSLLISASYIARTAYNALDNQAQIFRT